MDALILRTMRPDDAPAVAAVADRLAGIDYYPEALVREFIARGTVPIADGGAVTTAYVAELEGALYAFRFVLPPGRWSSGRGKGLTPARWPRPLEATAYFQSCFVDASLMGRGVGSRLARMALADLRRIGARAVAVHSWKESPHDSSRRYLARLGFTAIAEHRDYWADVDYLCSGCRHRPCLCTAIEMVLDLEG